MFLKYACALERVNYTLWISVSECVCFLLCCGVVLVMISACISTCWWISLPLPRKWLSLDKRGVAVSTFNCENIVTFLWCFFFYNRHLKNVDLSFVTVRREISKLFQRLSIYLLFYTKNKIMSKPKECRFI